MAAENAAAATVIDRHQDCDVNSVIPPTKNPTVASTHTPLATILAALFPKSLANTHEPSGQTMPAWSSNNLALCPE